PVREGCAGKNLALHFCCGGRRPHRKEITLATNCRITVVSSSAGIRRDAVAVSAGIPEGGLSNHRGQGLSMRINAHLVLEARKRKHWSQEELAIASGLNLRTIQ